MSTGRYLAIVSAAAVSCLVAACGEDTGVAEPEEFPQRWDLVSWQERELPTRYVTYMDGSYKNLIAGRIEYRRFDRVLVYTVLHLFTPAGALVGVQSDTAIYIRSFARVEEEDLLILRREVLGEMRSDTGLIAGDMIEMRTLRSHWPGVPAPPFLVGGRYWRVR